MGNMSQWNILYPIKPSDFNLNRLHSAVGLNSCSSLAIGVLVVIGRFCFGSGWV